MYDILIEMSQNKYKLTIEVRPGQYRLEQYYRIFCSALWYVNSEMRHHA